MKKVRRSAADCGELARLPLIVLTAGVIGGLVRGAE